MHVFKFVFSCHLKLFSVFSEVLISEKALGCGVVLQGVGAPSRQPRQPHGVLWGGGQGGVGWGVGGKYKPREGIGYQ